MTGSESLEPPPIVVAATACSYSKSSPPLTGWFFIACPAVETRLATAWPTIHGKESGKQANLPRPTAVAPAGLRFRRFRHLHSVRFRFASLFSHLLLLRIVSFAGTVGHRLSPVEGRIPLAIARPWFPEMGISYFGKLYPSAYAAAIPVLATACEGR